MKNKALYIGLGVVALGGLIYFMMRKKSSDASASEGMETKSAEASEPTASTVSVPPSKGSALSKDRPAAPTCGCGTGQMPCPNQRCASKATAAPVDAATAADPLFVKFGITMNDFNKMEEKAKEIKKSLGAQGVGLLTLRDKRQQFKKQLREFALMNNISYAAYSTAKMEEAKLRGLATSVVTSATDQMDSETETFAFNLSF